MANKECPVCDSKKKRVFAAAVVLSAVMLVFSGCGETASKEAEDNKPAGNETVLNEPVAESEEPDNKETLAEETEDDKPSLAQRMAGKYSYHFSGKNGEEEFFIMDVVNFGNNLCAFCGRAMPEDYESFEAYTFWTTEFIPYDAKEMASDDGVTARVNALNFSIMSNVGKYWDSGHTRTITLTDEGLVFEGFDHDGFLVPDYDDSRMFLKDERSEDAFSYMKGEKRTGDAELQGYWVCDENDADIYLRFSGSNMYMYEKRPDKEVSFAAGGCDFTDSSFDFKGNYINCGGEPFEFSADYKIDGDTLSINADGFDVPDQMAGRRSFLRISDRDVHVTTMDEVVFNEDSFGAFGQMEREPFYGVWVDAFREEEDAKALVAKLTDRELPATYVYSCDWENLNKDPYYCVSVGRSESESEAESYLDAAKEAGYSSAYVKYTGEHINR